jgi:hypothetical protein
MKKIFLNSSPLLSTIIICLVKHYRHHVKNQRCYMCLQRHAKQNIEVHHLVSALSHPRCIPGSNPFWEPKLRLHNGTNKELTTLDCDNLRIEHTYNIWVHRRAKHKTK